MFAPGFFTGNLIRRFGVTVIIMVGIVLTLCSMIASISGISLLHYWFSLVFIGVGWNFMFIGGTTLLTETYKPEERAKVQAFNDTLVFGTTAIASFSSGALLSWFGWSAVNLAIAAPATILLVFLFLLRKARHAKAA